MEIISKMYNEMLLTGTTPESLNVSKMTLIDKKQPSLLVSGKQPLTVSNLLLNLFTKII